MRAAKLFVITIATLLVVSCGPVLTLNTLFKESEIILDPALLGTWGEGETSLTFERREGKTYKLTYRRIFLFVLGRIFCRTAWDGGS